MGWPKSLSSFNAAKWQWRPWLLTWTFALVIFFVGLLGVESVWRHRGYRPSVVDSPPLWRFWYEHAVRGRRQSIALIGSSRMQAGISMTQMHRRLPHYRISQLAKYRGVGPIGVLRALALDERFNGIVICDTLEPFFVRTNWSDQRELYDFPADARTRIEAFASASAQDMIAAKHATTGLRAALERLLDRGHPPHADRVRIRVDRSLELDFTKLEHGERLDDFISRDVATARARYEAAQIPTPEELHDEFDEIDKFVREIQGRGGRVVFLRMPSSGKRRALEEEFHPKARYWDRFVKQSSGICIHADELKGITGMTCPDGSHLDLQRANWFTSVLIDALIQREVLDL